MNITLNAEEIYKNLKAPKLGPTDYINLEFLKKRIEGEGWKSQGFDSSMLFKNIMYASDRLLLPAPFSSLHGAFSRNGEFYDAGLLCRLSEKLNPEKKKSMRKRIITAFGKSHQDSWASMGNAGEGYILLGDGNVFMAIRTYKEDDFEIAMGSSGTIRRRFDKDNFENDIKCLESTANEVINLGIGIGIQSKLLKKDPGLAIEVR